METSNLKAILENRGTEPFAIMEVLHDVQEQCGYLPEEVLRQISASLDVPLIEVFRLANFYKAFSLKPRGLHLLTVCAGTACHVRGAPKILDEVITQLAVQPGDTTEDKSFTLETVNCLGACALGPVVVIDGTYHDHMTPAKLQALLGEIRAADGTAAGEGRTVSIGVTANA
jgi:NADH:ubiquinone oxidoreductase subunit E